jgi:hypothetical protein
MTDDCNRDIVRRARRNVAERYVQTYQINAILAGDWDKGCLVRDELEHLLKHPPLVAEEGEEI